MLTFKHFSDKPSWAAVAGYNYNILDCMSVAAINHNFVISSAASMWGDFLSWELREFPLSFLLSSFITLLAVLYPLYFWCVGIIIYYRCKVIKKKYRAGMSDVVRKNLNDWIVESDRRLNK